MTADTAEPGQRSLLRNTLFAIGGTGFYYVCQLGVLVLLAKFTSPEIQGHYLFGLAIATPVALFFGLELRGALVADAGNQFTFGTYRALRATMLVPAALLLAGFLAWTAGREHRIAFLLILAGVFAARLAWTTAEVAWGTYQRRERPDLLAVSLALRGLALLVPFAVLLPLYAHLRASGRIPPDQLANGTLAAVALHALGFALIYFLYDRPRLLEPGRWDLCWNWRTVRTLALQTVPLGSVALLINLCDSVPRVLIEQQPDGKAQLGYFGSLTYITLAGNLIVVQAATAAANRLSRYYQRDLAAFLRLGARLIGLAVAVGGLVLAVVFLFGPWILRILYRPEYAQFETEFQIVVVGQCLALLTNVLGAATTQMRLYWLQFPVQLVVFACTVVAAALLIPGAPVRGAAWTTLIRAIVQFALYVGCVALGLVFRQRIIQRAASTNVARPQADL